MRLRKFIKCFALICFFVFPAFFMSGCDTEGVKIWLKKEYNSVRKVLKLSYDVDPTPVAVENPTPGDIAVEPTSDKSKKNKEVPIFLASWGEEGVKPGQFKSPLGIAIDMEGNVYVADTYNCRVQKFTSDGKFLNSFGKRGSDVNELDKPYGVAVWEDAVYISDNQNSRIVKIDFNGQFLSAKCNDGDELGELHQPIGLRFDQEGTLFAADSANHRVQKLMYEALENNNAYNKGGAVDNKLLKSDINNPWNTHFPKYNEGPNAGQFTTPWDVLPLPSGDILVVDTYNHRIEKFGPGGDFKKEWGIVGTTCDEKNIEFQFPTFAALDQFEDVLVVDTGNHRIDKFTQDGEFLATFGSPGYDDGQFNQPHGIAVSQKNGDIFIVDTENNRIQIYTYRSLWDRLWHKTGEKPTPVPTVSPTPKQVIF